MKTLSPFYPTAYRSAILSLLLLLLPFTAVLAQEQPDQQERKELIGKALHVALVEQKNLIDYALLPDKRKIYISDQMQSMNNPNQPAQKITPDMLPEFKDIKFVLLPEEQIRKKAEKKGDILYVRLRDFDNYTEDAVIVNVESVWALSKKSQKRGLVHRAAGGISLLFNKRNSDWAYNRQVNYWMN